MLFSSKKERNLTDKAQGEIADLEIRVELTLTRKQSYSNAECADVKITKQLAANSDAAMRDLIAEVRDIVGNAGGEFESNIINSRHLSDGFIAAKEAENA